MIIYLARNKVNGKAYVGKTERSLEKRWHEHQQSAAKGSRLVFHCAIRKYGAESFDLRIIEESTTKEGLDELEKTWIAEFGTFGNGYNMTPGGDGGSLPGRVVSEKTRAKNSEVAKKRYAEGHGELMRSRRKTGVEHPFSGVDWGRKGPLTDETKRKISLRMTGKVLTDEHKLAISTSSRGRVSPNLGKTWTDAERQKHIALRYLKKKPVFGYDEAGTCVVAYLSLEDAMEVTSLGHRILSGNRKKYRPKYVNGITYKRSDLTIYELKVRS